MRPITSIGPGWDEDLDPQRSTKQLDIMMFQLVVGGNNWLLLVHFWLGLGFQVFVHFDLRRRRAAPGARSNAATWATRKFWRVSTGFDA